MALFVRAAWDRRPGETEAAYRYFRQYLEGPKPRNLQALSEAVAKTYTYIRRLSSAHKWYDRCLKYDDAVRKAGREVPKRSETSLHLVEGEQYAEPPPPPDYELPPPPMTPPIPPGDDSPQACAKRIRQALEGKALYYISYLTIDVRKPKEIADLARIVLDAARIEASIPPAPKEEIEAFCQDDIDYERTDPEILKQIRDLELQVIRLEKKSA